MAGTSGCCRELCVCRLAGLAVIINVLIEFPVFNQVPRTHRMRLL